MESMNQNEALVTSIVMELEKLSIAELRELWPVWDETMKQVGIPGPYRGFGRTAVNLVIEEKIEKLWQR